MENLNADINNELQNLRGRIAATAPSDLKLYFIVRYLKSGKLKRQAVMGKYLYLAVQAEIDENVQSFIYGSTLDDLDRILKKDFAMVEYDPISDDSDSLFTYSIKGKGLAFADVVENQLCRIVPRAKTLQELQENSRELWAYCIGFVENNLDTIFTFRKIAKAKVAIQDNLNPERKKGWFNTHLNPTTHQLEMLKGEVLTLDRQVDCVYMDESFYILRKTPFEQIVGIQEEFKEKALKVVEQLSHTGKIVGLEILSEKVNSGTGLHKKLAKIAKNGGIPELSSDTLLKMEHIGRDHGTPITVKEEKICIESEDDIDALIKMLGDYYKIGEISGKPYGTFAGKVLKKENT